LNTCILTKIANALRNTEYEGRSYIAGGFVRDIAISKLKKQPEYEFAEFNLFKEEIIVNRHSDIDIVVEMENGGENLASFLYKKGISSKPVIYENFGTAQVVIDRIKLEFVMTRSESYRGKSRKPIVKPATLAEDLYRRDFTVNSLLINLSSGNLIDVTQKGINDIKNQLICSTSDPSIIFREDPLRILRAVRFANQLDYQIEKATLTCLINSAQTLDNISWERKREEFDKILLSDTPQKGIQLLKKYKLLPYLIPEITAIYDLEQNKYHHLDVFNHTLEVVSHTKKNLVLRLAALLHDIGKGAAFSCSRGEIHFYNHESKGAELSEIILNRLKYSRKNVKLVSKLVANHMKLKNAGVHGEKTSDKFLRKLICDWSGDLSLLLKLIHADNLSHAPEYMLPLQIPGITKRVQILKSEMSSPHPPITGSDVMNYFSINEGKEVGRILSIISEIWFESPNLGRKELLEKASLLICRKSAADKSFT